MIVVLDIFSVTDSGPRWLGSTETVQQALVLAIHQGEGMYLIYSQQNGNGQYYKINGDGTVQRAVPGSDFSSRVPL